MRFVFIIGSTSPSKVQSNMKMTAKSIEHDIGRTMARPPKDKYWKRRAFTIGKYEKPKSKPRKLLTFSTGKKMQIATDIMRSHRQHLEGNKNH